MPKTTRSPFTQFHARFVALWGAGVLLGCITVTVLFYYLLSAWFAVESLLSPVLLLLFYGAFGYWLLRFLRGHAIALPALIGPTPRHWRWPQLVGLVALLLLSSLGSFLFWFGLRYGLFPDMMLEGLAQTAADAAGEGQGTLGLGQLLKVFTLVLMAPVVEELLFRGVLLQRWAVKWGMRPAILLSSLLFGACHASNPLGFTLFGLVMALLYVRTRSLLIPIVCHILNNALAEIVLVLVQRQSFVPAEAASIAGNSLWQGTMLLAIALPLLFWFIRKTWPTATATIPYHLNLQQERSPTAKALSIRARHQR